MATMFFSGVSTADIARALSRVPDAVGMMSFLEYSPELFATCESLGLRLVMDSGAYTRTLTYRDVERYARLIAELGDRCEWYANADIIGDQRRSSENHKILLSLLPPVLHKKVLWVYQVSASISHLDEALEQEMCIGVGGLVNWVQREENELALYAIAERIAQASREAHYFGLGTRRMLRRLWRIHQGRFSCDHTTWLVGQKYQKLIREDDGRQVPLNKTGFDLTIEEMLASNVRVMRKWIAPPEEVRITPPEEVSVYRPGQQLSFFS